MVFYVANAEHHALVSAASEQEAREAGEIVLGTPVTVARPATAEEIALSGWHAEMMRRQDEG